MKGTVLSLGSHKILDCINKKKANHATNICTDLYSWEELESLINIRPITNVDRFHTTGNTENLKWQASAWLSDVKSIPANCVIPVIEQGVCWISDMSRANKKINNICNFIEQKTGGEVDVHIYFDLYKSNNGTSLYKHWDKADNLIIQVEGQTNFKVWNIECTEGPSKIHTEEKPIIDVIMNPGDIIFIPKHIVHQATSLSKRLSLSIPISYLGDEKQNREWINISCKN